MYPLTKDEGVLERLAGVASGTAARLAEIEAAAGVCPNDESAHEWHEALHDALYSEPDVDRYHGFLVFGWHRVKPFAVFALAWAGLDPIGDVMLEPELVRVMLKGQEVVLPEDVALEALEGLGWS